MILLGLTGGVGMGKSTSAAWFQQQGVPVVDCDVMARAAVAPGQPAFKEIRSTFGDSVFAPDGTLDRRRLGQIVFSDARARQKLEAILHPRIRELWLEETRAWAAVGCPLGVVAIPLLFETNASGHFDATICVACSSASQQRRLLARGWDEDEVRRRLGSQWRIEQKMISSSFVVWNDHSHELLARQLRVIMSRVAPGAGF